MVPGLTAQRSGAYRVLSDEGGRGDGDGGSGDGSGEGAAGSDGGDGHGDGGGGCAGGGGGGYGKRGLIGIVGPTFSWRGASSGGGGARDELSMPRRPGADTGRIPALMPRHPEWGRHRYKTRAFTSRFSGNYNLTLAYWSVRHVASQIEVKWPEYTY